MIATTLAEIAAATEGRVVGDEALVVDGPAVVDSRRVVPGCLFVAVPGEHVDGHEFAAAALDGGAVATLATRSVPGPHVLVDDPIAALGRLARWRLATMRESGAPAVVAITGSQGKTSVKDLVAHVLAGQAPTVAPEGSFNNELGVPLTILRTDAATRFLVLEMGARGLGHIAALCRIAPPDVGVVLNVGAAHAGEFGGLDRTAQAKGEIVEALGPDGVAVVNADDPRVAAMRTRAAARVVTFGRAGDVRLVGEVQLTDEGTPRFEARIGDLTLDVTVPQIGEHQAMNALAALAVATSLGIDPTAAVAALAQARAGSPMRMERHVRADGVVVLNDAYNANPESTAAALRALVAVSRGRSIAVLGEMLELGAESRRAHEQVGALAAELGVDHVVAVGDGAAPIADGAGTIGEVAADVETAIAMVSARLEPDTVVLVKASRGVRLERVAEALLRD